MKLRTLFLSVLIMSALIETCGFAVNAQDQQQTPTPTPGLGTKRTDAHGIAQVYVPAGCFQTGSTDQQVAALNEQYRTSYFNNELPQHQVCLTQGYWLDTYEVTNAAYQAFIDAGGNTTRDYWSDAGWSWKDSRTAPDDCESAYNDPQQPRVCVSWYEAEAYAKWRGGRLPTEAEWEYAARGPDALIYPWGNTWDGSKANTAENEYGKTTPVGSYESGKSWVGAYDLAGNAWEWVADWYSDTYYQQQVKDDPTGSASGPYRVVRGGSWSHYLSYARAVSRDSFIPVGRDCCLGFRVVLVGVRPPSQ
jgi:iron(II)-dependent oxidoreductase